MSRYRTAWHLLAAAFIDERRPRCVQLEPEFTLSIEPQRADLLLIRRDEGPIDDARAFFRLWHLMGPVALIEYKSRGRPPRLGVLHQLLGYGHQYARQRQPDQPAERLSLFLLVPEITRTLRRDIELLGARLGAPDGCYTPVIGGFFPTWIVPLNQLADEEDDPLIGELGSRTVDEEDRESLQWLANFFMANEDRARKLEGFDELKKRFMKSPSFLEMTRTRFLEGQAEGLAEGRVEGLAEGRVEGLAEGRVEGRAEGRVEGRVEGQAEILLRLLERRFGDLPAVVQQRVRNAKPELLVRWTDRILDAPGLDDIFADD